MSHCHSEVGGGGGRGLMSHLSMEKFGFVGSGFTLWCCRGLKQLLQGVVSCTQSLHVIANCTQSCFFA